MVAIPQAGYADRGARTEAVLANVDAGARLAADWTPDRGAFGVAAIPQARDDEGTSWTSAGSYLDKLMRNI